MPDEIRVKAIGQECINGIWQPRREVEIVLKLSLPSDNLLTEAGEAKRRYLERKWALLSPTKPRKRKFKILT